MLNPADTKELFFVADGTGRHVFAETIKEHNANVQKWRAAEKDIKAKAAAERFSFGLIWSMKVTCRRASSAGDRATSRINGSTNKQR